MAKRGKIARRPPAARKAPSPRKRAPAGVDFKKAIATLKRELAEALERQAATSDVLKLISRSTFKLQTVLDTLTETAARLCDADMASIARQDKAGFYHSTNYKFPANWVEFSSAFRTYAGRASVSGRALLEGKAVQVSDVLADPEYRYQEQAERAGYRTFLAVPLLRNGQPIVVLNLARKTVKPFTDKQIELVSTFADQAVIAIENVRLFDEVKARTEDLSESLEYQTAISSVLNVISRSPSDIQPVLDTIAETAQHLCQSEHAYIFRLDCDRYHLVAAKDAMAERIQFLRDNPIVPDRSSTVGRVALERRPVHILDALADSEYTLSMVGDRGYRCILGVPMLRDGIAIGVIILTRGVVQSFTERQIELVTTFADQALIAIENVRLFDEVQARSRDLSESLEQQTATSEVLEVISSTPGELERVFQVMLANATRLCEAKFGHLYRWDGAVLRLVAMLNTPPALAEARARSPLRPGPNEPIGRMIASKKVVHVADATAEPAYFEQRDPAIVSAVELGGIRTILAVPMQRDNDLIGALTIYRQEVRPFTDKQIDLVTNFAAQAVIAIENARLLNELRESLEQQTATAKVLEVISRAAFDLQAVFETVAESSVKLCGADRAFIHRFDGELLHMAVAFNATQEFTKFMAQNPIRPSRSSTAGRAALERRTIHIPDVLADAEYSYSAKDVENIRTVLGVPILKGDELLGVMIIYHLDGVRPFTDKQITLVETFADQAAIAIENVRLLDELRQRTNALGRSVCELRALGEVSQAVNSTLDLETVLSTIVAKAVELSGTEAGAIYGYDQGTREFRLRATYGMDQELIGALTQRHIGFDQPDVALAFTQREPIQIADLKDEARSEVNEIILQAGYRARLLAPLLRGEEIVGMLVVRRKMPGLFTQNTIDLIKTFAAQSALAIQNARLFDNVETRTRELARSLDDLRTAQDRLVQTQKLASLGQLTAGIAHEIKNPLNFVNNFSGVSIELIDELQEALERVKADEKTRSEITELADMLRDNLTKIVQHGQRADSIVKNMLLHSREGSGERRPVDLNAIVEDSLNLAYHGARAEKQEFTIKLERSFDPAAGEADLFPQEITQVLLNLISNGVYAAMKRKAEMILDGYEPTLTAGTKNLGDNVEIRIRDNAGGIPPEVKEKIFNPFFTTKPPGEGTGLGLSLSYDIIVKQHSGSIEVDTEPGEFTEFRVILPRKAALSKAGVNS